MDLNRLKSNICDNIYEAQAKLGYEGRQMSLNYMNASICHLLGEYLSEDELNAALSEFASFVSDDLGEITFSPIKNGVCITIPEKGTAYINKKYDGGELIDELVKAVRSHAPIENFFDIFRACSDSVVIKDINNEEFRYLIYFADGNPNDYRYCLSVDEEIDGSIHVSYHRFIKEDYEDLGF